MQMFHSIITTDNIRRMNVYHRIPRRTTLARTGFYVNDRLSMTTETLNRVTVTAVELWRLVVQLRFRDYRNTQQLAQLSMKVDIMITVMIDVAENLGNGRSHPRYSERVDKVLVNNIVGVKLATLALALDTEGWSQWMKVMLSPLLMRERYRRYSNLLLSRVAWRFGSRQQKASANLAILEVVNGICCEEI